jgi:ribosomal protein L35
LTGSVQSKSNQRKQTMPKLKTRKCAAKRLKQTGTGKFMHSKAGGRHLKSSKNAKRRRRLRQDGAVKSTEMKRIKAALPYGL